VFQDLVPLIAPHDEQVIDVVDVTSLGGQGDVGVGQFLAVARGQLPSCGVPFVQVAQFDSQDCRLHAVQPAVVAGHGVVVLDGRAVVSGGLEPRGQVFVIGDDGSAVAHRSQVLAGVEAEAAGSSHAAGSAAFVTGSMCLGGVLNDQQAVLVGDGLNHLHLGRLAVQVYRQDRLGSGCDRRGKPTRIEVVCLRIVVDQNRGGPRVVNAQGRGDKRVRGGDDLVARSDPQALHRQSEGIQAAAHADAIFGLAVGGELLLERRQVRAGDEITLGQHLVDGRSNLSVQCVVQPFQIDQWY